MADNPPTAAPTEALGDYLAAYSLAELHLYRQRRSHPDEGWEDVTETVFGTWTPDAGGHGSQLQLFARSPFAFTRSTSRRWTDSFLDAQQTWPCTPQPEVTSTCIDWTDRQLDSSLPRLWEQEGATLSSEADLFVGTTADGSTPAVRLGPSTAPDGTKQPGLLWIGLPEAAAEVTATIEMHGVGVILRAWSRDREVAVDAGGPETKELRVVARGIDAVTLGWGLSVESILVRVCWVTAGRRGRSRRLGRRPAGARGRGRPLVEQRADPRPRQPLPARGDHRRGADEGRDGGRPRRRHAFRAVPDRRAARDRARLGAATAAARSERARQLPVRRRAGGSGRVRPLEHPRRGRRPGRSRAYDLGCEFDATCVQQMYGADMQIRVLDNAGRPALGTDGADLVFANSWVEAPTTTLATSESTWLEQLDGCTGAVEWLELAGDDTLRTEVPGLLYDDFSGTIETAWEAYVLDPSETRSANWHLDGGLLRQDVDVAGGDVSPDSPDKPGTAYVAGGIDAADVAVETLASADAGAYGLVFRWQGTGDYYRFSVGRQTVRLVRMRGGTVSELWSGSGGYAGGTTLLAVQAEGARIRCQVDERLVCDVREDDAETAPSGSVGLYTWNSTTAAFDEIRARAWPGEALRPERGYTARLEASRPLFTDALDDLAAFDVVGLATGDPSTASSAASGTATIVRPRQDHSPVVALAGDPVAGRLGRRVRGAPPGLRRVRARRPPHGPGQQPLSRAHPRRRPVAGRTAPGRTRAQPGAGGLARRRRRSTSGATTRFRCAVRGRR